MTAAELRDARSGAYTLDYFRDLTRRELDRSIRHGRTFSLITVRIAGEVERSSMLRELTEILARTGRESDVVAYVDEHEFCLLLPETGLLGALAWRSRALDLLDPETYAALRPQTGISVFPTDGEDLGRLMRTSRRRATRINPLTDVHGTRQRFWHAVDALLHPLPGDDAIPEDADATATRTMAFTVQPRQSVALLAQTVASDARQHSLDGVMYLFGDEGIADGVFSALQEAPEGSFRAWSLEEQPAGPFPFRLGVGDRKVTTHTGILALTDRSSWLLLGQAVTDRDLRSFQSADTVLVETLIRALQREYRLQPGVWR